MIIQLPITSSAKILVSQGDKFTSKTILAEVSSADDEKIINLARLLHVKADNISKYLKKEIGGKISIGDVIAKKKSFWSSSVVTSPISGLIKEIDLKKGTVTLLDHTFRQTRKISVPATGKIISVDKEFLEVEIEGHAYKIEKGKGEDVVGKLVHIAGKIIDILDIHSDVEQCIVICTELADDTMIKLEVLGVVGLVLQKVNSQITLPWGQPDEDIFGKLVGLKGKDIWLRPEEKQIIALE